MSQSFLHNAPEEEPRLQIVAGLHRGVDIKLDEREYKIGSSEGADIVLRDTNIAPEHVILHVENKAIRVEAIGGDIDYDGGVIAKGHGARLRFPVELALGEVRIRLTGTHFSYAETADRYWQKCRDFGLARPYATGGGFVIALLMLFSAAFSLPSSERSNRDIDAGAAPSVQADKDSSAVEQAVVALKRHLTDQNIDTVKVKAGDNRIAVSGRIAQSSVSAWNSVLKWFDETYTGHIVITSYVEVASDDEIKSLGKIRLQAVWFGERPYIILEDGTRYFEGALLDNGWIVKEIGEQKIVLNKADQTVAVSYR